MSSLPIAFDYNDAIMNHHLHLPITVFKKPETEDEYKSLESVLDEIIDVVRDDEGHSLAIAMQIIGDNLERYDNEVNQDIGYDISDIEMVEYLMEKHNLAQKNLAEIFGSQANVSKFLSGKRGLSNAQIAGLKHFFKISSDFFIK